MFSLTVKEQILIAAVLVALFCGAVIQHLRQQARTQFPDAVSLAKKPGDTTALER